MFISVKGWWKMVIFHLKDGHFSEGSLIGKKKRINWPKLCFRMIKPKIIFHEGLLLLSFHSSLSFIFFDSLFSFLVLFIFSIFLFYFFSFLFFSSWSELNTFLELHFSHLPFNIKHLNHSWFERNFSRICPSVWRVILGQGRKINYQVQRGD